MAKYIHYVRMCIQKLLQPFDIDTSPKYGMLEIIKVLAYDELGKIKKLVLQ